MTGLTRWKIGRVTGLVMKNCGWMATGRALLDRLEDYRMPVEF